MRRKEEGVVDMMREVVGMMMGVEAEAVVIGVVIDKATVPAAVMLQRDVEVVMMMKGVEE